MNTHELTLAENLVQFIDDINNLKDDQVMIISKTTVGWSYTFCTPFPAARTA